MFKKINHYLLLNKPQLWNIRLIPMLSIALVLHLVYFILGYGSIYSIQYFHEHYNYGQYSYKNEEIIHFSFGLLLFIIIIVWLFRYLRNNPFKSLYPLTKAYLIKEFLLIFLILFSLITIFHTYYYGKLLKQRSLSHHLDLVQQSDILNIAFAFLPFEKSEFEKTQSCENQEKTALELEKMNKANPCDYNNNSAATQLYIDTYSYTYYCQKKFNQGQQSSSEINSTIRRWLKHRQVDSIEQVLLKACKIADTYKIKYNLNIKTLVNYCFQDSINYSVNRFISNSYEEQTDYSSNYAEEAPELTQAIDEQLGFGFYELNYALSDVEKVRETNFFNVTIIWVFFYASLGFTIILSLFRFLRFKPWISGIIGVGVVIFIGVIIAISISSNIATSNIYVLFTLTCFFVSWNIINRKGSKMISAISLIWFSLFASVLIPVVFLNIYDLTREISYCRNGIFVIEHKAEP
ncbi:MAG: hypothetical protein IT245_02750, partial [Bacteroidia bacterium]|nr:hypothetical protein [Bacteroidia bacterium]